MHYFRVARHPLRAPRQPSAEPTRAQLGASWCSERMTSYTEVMHFVVDSNQATTLKSFAQQIRANRTGGRTDCFRNLAKTTPCSRSRFISSLLTMRCGRPNVFPLGPALRNQYRSGHHLNLFRGQHRFDWLAPSLELLRGLFVCPHLLLRLWSRRSVPGQELG